jgi:D-alanine-D-alanine ligase
MFDVPVVGSSAQACQYTAHKHTCQKLVDDVVASPPSVLYTRHFTPEEMAEEARSQFMPPFFVKPAATEGSFGIEEVQSVDELLPALKRCREHGDVLLQERAQGQEATITLTEDEHGNPQTLPAVMVTPRTQTFYDHMAKRRDGRVGLQVAPESTAGLPQAVDTAHMLYEALGCRGLVSFDMILDGNHPSLLDVNPIPTLTAFTPLKLQLAAAQLHPSLLFDRLIRQSLQA